MKGRREIIKETEGGHGGGTRDEEEERQTGKKQGRKEEGSMPVGKPERDRGEKRNLEDSTGKASNTTTTHTHTHTRIRLEGICCSSEHCQQPLNTTTTHPRTHAHAQGSSEHWQGRNKRRHFFLWAGTPRKIA